MNTSNVQVDENRTKAIEDWMSEQIVPSLEFSGLTDEQLYYIFTVYNTNSTSLKRCRDKKRSLPQCTIAPSPDERGRRS